MKAYPENMTPRYNISISENTLAINFITLSISHHNIVTLRQKDELFEVFVGCITYGT